MPMDRDAARAQPPVLTGKDRTINKNGNTPRLSNALLARLDASMNAPCYDRSVLARSIVHVGVGGFHRAHLAKYVDALCRRGSTDWSIIGTGVMPGDSKMADALLGQDCLYTLVERGADSKYAQIVGSIVDFIHAHPDNSALVDAIAAPSTQIVSLTVTEGGYPVDDTTGCFDPKSANASDDSAFATIIAGLAKRMAHGAGPVTVMSCDNVMTNGNIARASAMGIVGDNVELSTWIEENVAFPNSMVDRITPATTDDDREWFSSTYRYADSWPVVCEPFLQWVVEDNFSGARLPLEDLADLGVTVTDDVGPYEHMKLQLLNAGHICLAYPAALLEHELVHDAMADGDVLNFMKGYLHREAKTSLHPVPGMNFDEYIDMCVERFTNPQVCDQVGRLCQDATGRFPKFVLPSVRTQLQTGGPVVLSALLFACWRKYLLGTTEAGNPIDHEPDPFLCETLAAAHASTDNPVAFLALPRVFDVEIAENAKFIDAFCKAASTLDGLGVRATINLFLDA